jgi:hypothetical protein
VGILACQPHWTIVVTEIGFDETRFAILDAVRPVAIESDTLGDTVEVKVLDCRRALSGSDG